MFAATLILCAWLLAMAAMAMANGRLGTFCGAMASMVLLAAAAGDTTMDGHTVILVAFAALAVGSTVDLTADLRR